MLILSCCAVVCIIILADVFPHVQTSSLRIFLVLSFPCLISIKIPFFSFTHLIFLPLNYCHVIKPCAHPFLYSHAYLCLLYKAPLLCFFFSKSFSQTFSWSLILGSTDVIIHNVVVLVLQMPTDHKRFVFRQRLSLSVLRHWIHRSHSNRSHSHRA